MSVEVTQLSGVPARIVGLEAIPASSGEARRFVTELTEEWGLARLAEEAALCATELATNAILHTRERFVITVRPIGEGVRIEVMDGSPHRLPVATPRTGAAVDLTTLGLSGRGLQIVSAVASRWGMFTTYRAKTIWAEVTGESNESPSEPILILERPGPRSPDAVELLFLGLPTRAAVSSGIQVEDVVRGVQLEFSKESARPDDRVSRLFDLLDRTASVRLSGRHAALLASAVGDSYFDFNVWTEVDALVGLGELSSFLRDIADVLAVPVARPSDEVNEFREWLNEETSRQLTGVTPTQCHLPA
ncbi:MAG TPA: ATP-binding protein [Acidimicrobiales bacterium]|jgi:anti-sigma regulatory factor (Ser/Thr protein kinase)